MDKTVFVDPSIVSFINENMYAIKFDAEVKHPIIFDGIEYSNTESSRRGTHELANAILNDQMTYPTIVYFNENLERITISQGYKEIKDLKRELNFVKKKAYLNVHLHDYMGE